MSSRDGDLSDILLHSCCAPINISGAELRDAIVALYGAEFNCTALRKSWSCHFVLLYYLHCSELVSLSPCYSSLFSVTMRSMCVAYTCQTNTRHTVSLHSGTLACATRTDCVNPSLTGEWRTSADLARHTGTSPKPTTQNQPPATEAVRATHIWYVSQPFPCFCTICIEHRSRTRVMD